jgi:DNA-directed RNA polymerase specialized sigma24 family protein
MKPNKLTEHQFAALAELRGSSVDSKSTMAARMVLCHGMKNAEAQQAVGTSPQAVSNAVSRYRRALALAKIAAGVQS